MAGSVRVWRRSAWPVCTMCVAAVFGTGKPRLLGSGAVDYHSARDLLGGLVDLRGGYAQWWQSILSRRVEHRPWRRPAEKALGRFHAHGWPDRTGFRR